MVWMEEGQAQAEVLRLLRESPLTSEQVIQDVRESIRAGEVSLAFDILVSWLYEDTLPISPQFYEELVVMTEVLYMEEWNEKLRELVRDG